MDDQTAVLKAHLLVEGLIRDFCFQSVRNPSYLRDLRLNFHQVVQLARSFMVFESPAFDKYWGMVNTLNQLRNLMAHELEPDQARFEKCRKALIAAAAQEQATLNQSLAFLCGAMNSLLPVALELHRKMSRRYDEADPADR